MNLPGSLDRRPTAGPPSPVGSGFAGALNAITGIFGRAANQVIALIVTLLAARWLTPATFGAYAIAAALVVFSRAMLYAGAYEYLLKAPGGEEAMSECLIVNVALAAVIGGLLMVVSTFITPVFHTSQVGFLLMVLAPSSLLSAAANWQEAQLLRVGRIKTYYGVTTFAEVTAAAVTVAMILAGLSLGALVAQIYVRLFTLMATYRVIQKPTWSKSVSFARVVYIARWSLNRYGATMTTFLSNYSADILLGAFLSPAAAGLYRASHRMVTGVSDLISNPTRMTAITIFSRRAAEGEPSGPLWPKIAAASAFLGWTALAGLAAVSSQVVPMVLGARWGGAGPIIAILCLQRAFTLIDGVTAPLLVAYNHVRALLAVQIAMAVASVILLILIARFGVAAAAVSSALTAGLSTAICGVIVARDFPGLLRELPGVLPVAILPALATSVAAFGTVQLLSGGSLDVVVALGLEVGAGVAAFALTAFLLRARVLRVLQSLNPSPAKGRGDMVERRRASRPMQSTSSRLEDAVALKVATEAEAWDYSA